MNFETFKTARNVMKENNQNVIIDSVKTRFVNEEEYIIVLCNNKAKAFAIRKSDRKLAVLASASVAKIKKAF